MKTAETYRKDHTSTGCYRSESEAHADCDELNRNINDNERPWKVYETIPGVIWNVVRFPQFRNRVDK